MDPKFQLHYYKSIYREGGGGGCGGSDKKEEGEGEKGEKEGKNQNNRFQHGQTFYPLYTSFFQLSPKNWDRIVFNNPCHLIPGGGAGGGGEEKEDEEYLWNYETNTRIDENVPHAVFKKYAPLLDPIRYMMGKYANCLGTDRNSTLLPSLQSCQEKCGRNKQQQNQFSAVENKLHSLHNAAYIDSFFVFLSGCIAYRHHSFIHGVEYFGTYLGIQKKFEINIIDEIDYLEESSFFMKNVGTLFEVENNGDGEDMDDDEAGDGDRRSSSKKKKKMVKVIDDDDEDHGASGSSSSPLPPPLLDVIDIDMDIDMDIIDDCAIAGVVQEKKGKPGSGSGGGGGSSRNVEKSSETGVGGNEESGSESGESDSGDSEGNESGSGSESGSEGDDDEGDDDDDDNKVMAAIYEFPVQMICMERCEATIDSLFEKGQMNEMMSASMIFQIIMILITYQKMFDLTHNDLHTNNVMFTSTSHEFLYYRYESKWYKVPTYGRIFKIIDFGRAIYRFQGKVFCSDSFDKNGDAHTQYNTEPFYNPKKPRIDPNPSFDLSRFASSIYDFIIDQRDEDKEVHFDLFQKLIHKWCSDDKGANILYKRNGDERYPQFQLYKMIAKNVHHHTPQTQLDDPLFALFHTTPSFSPPPSSSSSPNDNVVINIDSFPRYA